MSRLDLFTPDSTRLDEEPEKDVGSIVRNQYLGNMVQRLMFRNLVVQGLPRHPGILI